MDDRGDATGRGLEWLCKQTLFNLLLMVSLLFRSNGWLNTREVFYRTLFIFSIVNDGTNNRLFCEHLSV